MFKGQLLCSMGQKDEAVQVFHRAMSIAPNDLLAAQIRQMMGEPGE